MSLAKSFGHALESLENKLVGVDIHDPKMWTPITPGSSKSLWSGRLFVPQPWFVCRRSVLQLREMLCVRPTVRTGESGAEWPPGKVLRKQTKNKQKKQQKHTRNSCVVCFGLFFRELFFGSCFSGLFFSFFFGCFLEHLRSGEETFWGEKGNI